MTAVGKILVFLNLVFALVVGAFAVMTYVARTHWSASYKQLEASHTVLKSSNEAYKAKQEKQDADTQTYNKAMYEDGVRAGVFNDKQDPTKAAGTAVLLLKKRQDEIVTLKRNLDDEKKKADGFERDMNKYQKAMTLAQAEVQRRLTEVEKLREILADETKRNNELIVSSNKASDRAVAAKINADSFKDRNTQLEGQLQEMGRDLARLKASGGRPAGTASNAARNPPPESVEGLIQKVDGKYVTLTIGSDSGLQKGHTLHVFGMKNNPGYRGQIKIAEVSPKAAVAEVLGKLSQPIRSGDTAASEIMKIR